MVQTSHMRNVVKFDRAVSRPGQVKENYVKRRIHIDLLDRNIESKGRLSAPANYYLPNALTALDRL